MLFWTGEIVGGGVCGKMAVEGSSGVMYRGSVVWGGEIGDLIVSLVRRSRSEVIDG